MALQGGLLLAIGLALGAALQGVAPRLVMLGVAVLALAAAIVLKRRVMAGHFGSHEDLHAAGPFLTPDERARAFRYVGSLEYPGGDPPEVNELRAYLEALPGGMRRRSSWAIRDPDLPWPPRGYIVRALLGYPLAMLLPAAVVSAVHGEADAWADLAVFVALLGPPTATYFDRGIGYASARRRALWALCSVAMTMVLGIGGGVAIALVG